MIEILAPAGNPESLTAAINTGADAVYLGLSDFSARRNARNFTPRELYEAARICRLSGIKVYVTFNTLLFENETEKLTQAVKTVYEAGADAVIIQDLSLIDVIRETAPELKIHASTQMTINSASGIKAAKGLGISRVILARELTLTEIEEITRAAETLGVETEVFVHGALCVSVSGQCFMSGFFGGDDDIRSANRGLCAQPCRLNFTTENINYALSMKDLSIINHIKKLEEIGVASVKIEGRMKRPEYVAAAVDACIKARRGEEPDIERLKAVFSRDGFTDGYFTGETRSMRGFRAKEDVLAASEVLAELRSLYKEPMKRRIIDMKIIIKADNEVLCSAYCAGVTAELSFPPAEKAQTRATDAEEMTARLKKLGGTIFEAGEIICEIDRGLFLGSAKINQIRREIINEISERLINENTFD